MASIFFTFYPLMVAPSGCRASAHRLPAKPGDGVNLLVQAGHKLTTFKEDEINLETAFMALTKGITA